MKVIVCGGRNYTDQNTLFREMDRIHAIQPITLVIEGGQRTRDKERGLIGGADYWAYMWAASRRVAVVREDANWNDLSQPDARIKTNRHGEKYDSNAGPRRNRRMITKYQPDAIIPFPGGEGTADMVRQGYEFGVEILQVNP